MTTAKMVINPHVGGPPQHEGLAVPKLGKNTALLRGGPGHNPLVVIFRRVPLKYYVPTHG